MGTVVRFLVYANLLAVLFFDAHVGLWYCNQTADMGLQLSIMQTTLLCGAMAIANLMAVLLVLKQKLFAFFVEVVFVCLACYIMSAPIRNVIDTLSSNNTQQNETAQQCFSTASCGSDLDPFAPRFDYTEILKVNPLIAHDKSGKINWIAVAVDWRKSVYKEFLPKGYYGVLFVGGKAKLIVKLSMETIGKYRSLFVSQETTADVALEIENPDDCFVNAEIRYGCDIKDGVKNFGFIGKCAFVENVMTLPSLNNNICFVIYDLN